MVSLLHDFEVFPRIWVTCSVLFALVGTAAAATAAAARIRTRRCSAPTTPTAPATRCSSASATRRTSTSTCSSPGSTTGASRCGWRTRPAAEVQAFLQAVPQRLCRPSCCAATGCACSASARLAGVRARGRALHARGPRDPLLRAAWRASRAATTARSPTRAPIWLEPTRAARGLRAPRRRDGEARPHLDHRHLAARARAVRERADHRRQDHARLPAEGRVARRARARRGGAPAQALPRGGCRRASSGAPAREVAVLAGVRYARDDPEAMAEGARGRARRASCPTAELRYLWGRVAYEGAR